MLTKKELYFFKKTIKHHKTSADIINKREAKGGRPPFFVDLLYLSNHKDVGGNTFKEEVIL